MNYKQTTTSVQQIPVFICHFCLQTTFFIIIPERSLSTHSDEYLADKENNTFVFSSTDSDMRNKEYFRTIYRMIYTIIFHIKSITYSKIIHTY